MKDRKKGFYEYCFLGDIGGTCIAGSVGSEKDYKDKKTRQMYWLCQL